MMASTSGGEGTSFDIQSVSRVGQILALYGPQTAELTAVQVAERLDLNRTTAYRYCTSLVTAGILERGHRRGTFVLGGLILQLGIQALGRRGVIEIARPYLRRLSADAGMTVALSLWGTTGPVVALVQEDPTSAVVVTVRVGSELDATSAQMRVFLAYLPDPHLLDRAAERLSPGERASLENAIYAVRRSGYSSVSLPDGLFGAAAPIFDEHGIAATIAVLGAGGASNVEAGSPTLLKLIAAASDITDALASGREGERGSEL
jgi:DNA-binding IclR family transcriptional regulator